MALEQCHSCIEITNTLYNTEEQTHPVETLWCSVVVYPRCDQVSGVSGLCVAHGFETPGYASWSTQREIRILLHVNT